MKIPLTFKRIHFTWLGPCDIKDCPHIDTPHQRYWGYQVGWYDGPIYSFGFWWFHIYMFDKEDE